MLFTDKFVYVHEPKTGGTFVTSVLFRLYGLNWTRLTHLRNIIRGEVRAVSEKYGTLVHNNNKHGGCNEIPTAQREKKILATIRNPYDIYVSQYEFGWWKRREFLRYYRAVPDFEKEFARFPDLSFAEYVRLANAAFTSLGNGKSDTDDSAGLHTEQFLKFYFRNPAEAFRRIGADDYLAPQAYKADMYNLHFIRTDNLNRGLYDFLSQMSYGHDDIRFILETGKILPKGKGRSDVQKWERYYTPELKQTIRHKERFLFKLFPEFDV
jgi:hypothetical protein